MRSLKRRYLRKRIDYSQFVKYYFSEGDLTVISVNAKSIDDIISRYSVKNYEMLDNEFEEYVVECAELVPDDKPLVLNISGTHFTDEEKRVITEAIRDRFRLESAQVDANEKGRRIKIGCMVLAGAVIALVMALFTERHPELIISSQIVGILFWVCVDSIIEGVFFETEGVITSKIRATQLATMAIRFEDTFVDEPYSGEERQEIFEEIDKELE